MELVTFVYELNGTSVRVEEPASTHNLPPRVPQQHWFEHRNIMFNILNTRHLKNIMLNII